MEDVTLISVVQSSPAPPTLDAFLGYYLDVIGIRDFVIIVQGTDPAPVKDAVARALGPDCRYEFHDWTEPFDDRSKIELINYYKMQARTEFTLVVDADEFVTANLPALHSTHASADFIQMRLVDRIGPYGRLIPLSSCTDWKTLFDDSFPAKVSDHFGSDACKYALTRRNVLLLPGQHGIQNWDQLLVGGPGGDIPLYHFKWVEGVVELLEHRLVTLDANANSAWYGEMARQYVHLKKYGGFRPDLLSDGKIV